MRHLLATIVALAGGCAGHLDIVRPVMPERSPEATTVWPSYVTPDDRALLEDSERRIDEVRKGELLVSVRDARGLAVDGMTVRYRQISHDFQFGVSAVFSPSIWGDLVRAGVNRGAVEVDWSGTEPRPDSWTLEAAEASYGLGILPGMGVQMSATAALWMTPDRTPEHVQKLEHKALLRTVDRHVRGLVSRLRGRVSLWEALREPNTEWAMGIGKSPDAMVELALTAAQAVRSVDAVTPIGVSLTNPFGEGQSLAPLAFVKRLEDAGLDLDVVGLEYYYNGYRRAKRQGSTVTADVEARRGLTDIATNLEDFSRFGRTLAITGVGVPSEPCPADAGLAGYWGRRWSEELQAVYLRAFYTLAFSTPKVEAVVWRDATDATAMIEHGGLFRKAGSPKPALFALSALIDAWTTRGEGATTGEGLLRFRGFGGKYVVEITHPVTGERLLRTVRVRERELNSTVIDLPTSWLPHDAEPSLADG